MGQVLLRGWYNQPSHEIFFFNQVNKLFYQPTNQIYVCCEQ